MASSWFWDFEAAWPPRLLQLLSLNSPVPAVSPGTIHWNFANRPGPAKIVFIIQRGGPFSALDTGHASPA